MAIDMNLISLKDGGRFAMSWIAGTNPKALRSNFQRHQIYSVDIIEVCEDMIESVKIKEDKLSFRILFRLCFGTILIYAEQVQHLYDVTRNFVCFNTFVIKQYSRKRLSSTVADSSENKRSRLESSDDLDISSLLMESEIFNNYTEDKFQFPNEVGHDNSCIRKNNTSTCIQIKQITIQHVSWDNPMPEEEDAFGDASLDERSILLSGLNDSLRKSPSQKRKPCYTTSECSPLKKPCLMNESVDDVRYNQSIHNETPSDAELYDSLYQTIQDSDKNTTDFNDNDITHIDFESTRKDSIFPRDEELNYQASNNRIDHYALEDSTDIPLPDILQEYINRNDEDNVIDNTSRIDSPSSSFSLNEIRIDTTLSGRKRKRPELIIDTYTKIQKIDFENIWKHCFDINRPDHLASTKEPRKPIAFNKRIIERRFQSDKLLNRFNKNLKLRLQQNHNNNRRLIVKEILDDDFDEFKNLFGIKTSYTETIRWRKPKIKKNIERIEQVDETENNIIHNNINKNSRVFNDYNNNIQIEKEQNHLQIESNGYNRYETKRNNLTLNCSLNEVNPFAISFDFQLEAENLRSEWGKEGIIKKLLFAWIAEDPIVNMKTIISGANRINAALAFHTLLDLSGQQYIEIVKGQTNSIESINMGPEMIKKINESCA